MGAQGLRLNHSAFKTTAPRPAPLASLRAPRAQKIRRPLWPSHAITMVGKKQYTFRKGLWERRAFFFQVLSVRFRSAKMDLLFLIEPDCAVRCGS